MSSKVEKLSERVAAIDRSQSSPRSNQDTDSWVGKIVRMLSSDEQVALAKAIVSREKDQSMNENVWIEQLPPDQQAVVKRVHSLLQEFGVEAK